MNKRKFTILIIMMLLSIVGIIWVQIVWIKDAVTIQNTSFNNAIAMRLDNAREIIETSSRMNFFNNFMFQDPLSPANSPGYSGFMSIQSYSSRPGNGFSLNITNQSFSGNNDTSVVNKRTYTINDSTFIADSSSYIGIQNPDGSIRIANDTGFTNAGSPVINMKQKEYLDWVKKRASQFQNLSDQVISEIYQWEKTLELKDIDIKYALSVSLAGIETPYEYAIIRNGVVQPGTYLKADEEDFLKNKYMVRLFPDNIIRQEVVLSVIFPERTNYVLGSIIWLLGGSFVFSLFILATFALSLYLIIRQKKITEIKSDFLNNMTHEFKTPIATISLAADTITNPKVIGNEEKIRHFVGMIKKENSRMNKKVETILQIASLDKKEIDFRFEDVSIHTIIEHAVETIEIQVQQRFGKIILHLDAKEPVISGDSEHLTNLVNNFLDNAIKYSPGSPEITVTTGNTDKGIIITFEDKGIGMSKAVQSKIFERFYRQSSGNVHDVKGFGLGLNYARAIIDAHKGNISVFSEPGKGSRFEIFLPFNLES